MGGMVSEIASFIRPFVVVVKISKDEREFLDIKAGEQGWKTSMPLGWTFDKGCIYARLQEREPSSTRQGYAWTCATKLADRCGPDRRPK